MNSPIVSREILVVAAVAAAGLRAIARCYSRIANHLWRRRRRRRRSGRAEIELHRWRLFRARLRSEERPWRKTQHTRHEICWETAHRDIVVLHCLVEITAFDRDSVLGAFELRLQTEKILVRL